mgnify:CR=1 FL=1
MWFETFSKTRLVLGKSHLNIFIDGSQFNALAFMNQIGLQVVGTHIRGFQLNKRKETINYTL